jgi:hypothetical protein
MTTKILSITKIIGANWEERKKHREDEERKQKEDEIKKKQGEEEVSKKKVERKFGYGRRPGRHPSAANKCQEERKLLSTNLDDIPDNKTEKEDESSVQNNEISNTETEPSSSRISIANLLDDQVDEETKMLSMDFE